MLCYNRLCRGCFAVSAYPPEQGGLHLSGTMDYRAKWRAERERRTRRRVLIAAGICGALLVVAVLCLRTGATAEVWHRDMEDECPPEFAIAGERVVCALSRGRVMALHLDNGDPAWQEPFEGSIGFHEAPVVANRAVIAAGDGGFVHALSLTTGRPLWKVETGDAMRCPPLVERGVVYVGTDGGRFLALEVADGRERWRHEIGAAISSGSVLVGKTVVLGTTDGRIVGLNVSDGTPRWLRTVSMPVVARPVGVGRRVLIGTDGGSLYSLDAATGLSTASARLPGGGLIRADLIADANLVFAATTCGWVAAYDARTLEQRWARKIGPELSAGPVSEGEHLLCAAGDDGILALDKSDGKVRRRFRCPGKVRGRIATGSGMIVAATDDAVLFALHTPE